MIKPFNLEDTPLDGVHLIEAGAGTGKTYAITGLFLRLIVEQATGIERILVVTYTKAATQELKGRIRRRLLAARAFLSGDAAADTDLLIEALIRKGLEPRRALQRIQDALVDFDRAAIFTIHGFCQRVLHHFAFETGHLFEAELVQDALPMIPGGGR
jgi:exodeoxyribonuclease V beta subunit